MTQDTIIDFPETPVAYAAGASSQRDYHAQIPAFGTTSAEMRCRQDFDPSRPCVEVYRSQRDMYVMVPVR